MSLHFLILAAVTWRVVRWRMGGSRRNAARRDRTPWLAAAVSDAVIFGGLAYREHRRKVRAGKPTARRDGRKSTWTTSTPLGGDDRAVRPRPGRRATPHPGQDTGIPY